MLKFFNKHLSFNVKNAGLLFFFSGFASGLGYLFNTLVAQKLSINDFGVFRLILDTVGALFPCLLFGFQYTWTRKIISANVQEQERLKAGSLVIVITLAVFATFLISVMVFIASKSFVVGQYLILIPYAFVICIPLVKDLVTGLLTAQKKIYLLCMQFIAPQLLCITLVFFQSGNLSLKSIVNILVISNLISGLFLLYLSGLSFKNITVTLRLLLSENKQIGLPIYLSSYLSMASLNITQILSGFYLTTSEYANLSMAFMLSGVLSLVSGAVGMIKTQDFSKESEISIKVRVGTFVVMLTSGLIAILAAFAVKTLILSSDFDLMLLLIPFLVVAALFQGQSDIINRFLLSKDMAKKMAKISATNGVIGIVGGVALIPILGIWGAVSAKVILSVLNYILNVRAYKLTLSDISRT